MKTKALTLGVLFSCAAMATAGDAKSDFKAVYGNVPDDQAEFLTSSDRIKSVAANGAPMAVWEALEHAESVECLDCIAAVEPLLYDKNARTREISAWWLRRRVLGVFGPGEVYERTVNTLKSDANAQRRAYAAYALGEFLTGAGVPAVAAAITTDADGGVRAAAASALGRLNDDGGGALATAMKDAEPRVKFAALGSAGRINSFTAVANVAALVGDTEPLVRRRAVELLDSMRAKDSVASVAALAKSDPDANVRLAACHALGAFKDTSVRGTLQTIADTDASTLVRDQAKIALRRL